MRIREFRGTDFEALAKLLGSTWHDDGSGHSYWLGADELCHHLAASDHGFTAEADDGTFLGAILAASPAPAGRNLEQRNHWRQQRTQIARMAQVLGVDSKADAVYSADENALVRRAEAEIGSEGVGLLTLLIVDEAARGQGIGKQLLRAGVQWLADGGATQVRLFTDDDCDYALYDHLDMGCVLTSAYTQAPQIRTYIYEAPIAQLLEHLE